MNTAAAGVGSRAPSGSRAATVDLCVPSDSPVIVRDAPEQGRATPSRRHSYVEPASDAAYPTVVDDDSTQVGGTEVSVVSGGVGAGGPGGAVTTTAAGEDDPPAHDPTRASATW